MVELHYIYYIYSISYISATSDKIASIGCRRQCTLRWQVVYLPAVVDKVVLAKKEPLSTRMCHNEKGDSERMSIVSEMHERK
jgi:hypothetical protein